ncbi:MAG: hypothetical protein AB8B89_05440 [Gammaproteobacteria bacterium]
MKENDGKQRNVQIQIPNAHRIIETPMLVITDSGSHANTSIHLDDVFDQVLQSYKNDPAALHQFSYYLLLQSKEFARSETGTEESETIGLAKGG